MSRVGAIRQSPGPWIDEVAARLRAHRWVLDAHVGVRDTDAARLTAYVLPSADGVRALRTSGKSRLTSELAQWLRDAGIDEAAELDYRLCESLPTHGIEAADSASRRHWMPVVVDLATNERGISCVLRVPYELAIFRGHFPERPIVPGVMQVGWAATLSRDHGLADGPLTGIPAAKFNRLVRPGMELLARIERGLRPGQVQFEYRAGDVAVASGKLQFGAARD